jgi:hypothetical protein
MVDRRRRGKITEALLNVFASRRHELQTPKL